MMSAGAIARRLLPFAAVLLAGFDGRAGRPPVFGISLTTDRPNYLTGGTINARITISTVGDESLTLHFATAQRCEFAIQDTSGANLWRWGADRMFAQVTGAEALGPSRTELVCRERLTAPRTAGVYRLVGAVVSSDRPMSATVSIAVGEGPSGRP
jgi:hypothetical protein